MWRERREKGERRRKEREEGDGGGGERRERERERERAREREELCQLVLCVWCVLMRCLLILVGGCVALKELEASALCPQTYPLPAKLTTASRNTIVSSA